MKVNKRTYINKEQTDQIIKYFDELAPNKKVERQVIYTYHSEADFRLIRTTDYVTLDLKDNNNEDVVFIHKKYEKSMINILTHIGSYVAVKRFRTRHMYNYDNFYITVDENLKYGNVLRICYKLDSSENEKQEKIQKLYQYFDIEENDMEKFEELYSKYRNSWADLTKEIDEELFLNGKQY